MENTPITWLPLVYSLAGGIVALGGKIMVDWIKRKWAKTDVLDTVHLSTKIKEIDADVDSFKSMLARLATVEGWLQELQQELAGVRQELADQRVENTKLEGQNERLTADNIRQEGEIKTLRARVHDLAQKVQEKDILNLEQKEALKRADRDRQAFQMELHETRMEVNALKRKMPNSGEHKMVKDA